MTGTSEPFQDRFWTDRSQKNLHCYERKGGRGTQVLLIGLRVYGGGDIGFFFFLPALWSNPNFPPPPQKKKCVKQ